MWTISEARGTMPGQASERTAPRHDDDGERRTLKLLIDESEKLSMAKTLGPSFQVRPKVCCWWMSQDFTDRCER